ncbi:MAG TPA: SpvB/TcaC N-terminal domain-containing protein, partial [Gaiellaceae bacterium]|nr:SpvB/TcaC N-terminal domain-containing protein [Gaiellaceae bacterium]
MALVALAVVNAPSAEVLGGVLGSTLTQEPQLRPAELGNAAFEGLVDPDPAEGVDLIDPPSSNNQGTAQLSQPLSIPAGRGGFQPDLSVDYDSSGGNSWLGTGWDLSFGDISVDTEWGVPRYLSDKESETYLLDGDQLTPTAVRTTQQGRVAERHDFMPRVDTSYQHIVRHGNSPQNYWWEVTDKLGGKRWYGGVPDCGGPDGYERGQHGSTEPTAGLQRDGSAILGDASGNAFRWALSAERDVGGNLIRYYYDKVTTHPWGANGPAGTQLYISKIRYTGWATGDCTAEDTDTTPATDFETPPEDEAYEIKFLRDGGVTPPIADANKRKDIIVDATGGFLQVTTDLLRRIEIYHGIPKNDKVLVKDRASRTDYTELVRAYDFHYNVNGAFGKSLLTKIDQLGSDGNVYASNSFDYYDDVRNASGGYVGFGSTDDTWDSRDDQLGKNLFGPVGTSVLGSADTNAGDVHAYIGFNPEIPEKG